MTTIETLKKSNWVFDYDGTMYAKGIKYYKSPKGKYTAGVGVFDGEDKAEFYISVDMVWLEVVEPENLKSQLKNYEESENQIEKENKNY